MLETIVIYLAIHQMVLEKPPVREQGIATYYNPFGSDIVKVRGKRVNMCPGKLACSWWGYRAGPNDLFLAHRSLPCGMKVWVRNVRTRKMAQARVLDRGTFGALGCYRPGSLRCVSCGDPDAERGWCIKIYKHEPGRWRGIADLSPALTKALKHNGMEKVQLLYTKAAFKEANQEWQRRRTDLEARRMSRMPKSVPLQRVQDLWAFWIPGGVRESLEE